MSIRAELQSAARVPLRYLVTFNPRPQALTRDESCYLPMEAISEFGSVDSSRMRPTEDLVQGYSYIADGDVAYAKVTPCFENGKGLHARGLPGGYAFATTEITVMRPRTALDSGYLAWILQSDEFRAPGESHMTGAGGLKRVPESFAASFPIPLPSIEVQRAIADYLDRETAQIDAFIVKNEELISLLTERRVAIIADRIVGSPDRGRGEKLGYSCRLGNGSTPRREESRYWTGGHFPRLNSSVVNQDRVRFADQFVTDSALTECHLPRVEPGAVVVGLTGEGRTRGMATIVDIEATVNQHLGYIQPDLRWWLPDYLLWLVRSRYTWLRDVSNANGATKGGLTVEQLRAMRVERPSLAEQRRLAAEIESQVATISGAVATASAGVDLARERRAALISAAVTGKIDVGVTV